jgi:cystathionine beta-lyase/cystathionine gamma-synthase
LKNRDNSKLSVGSGMLGFYVKRDLKKINKVFSRLELITLAEFLGGVKSLIESPALMTHGWVVPIEVRKLVGIIDNHWRLSCGIENIKDLIKDFDRHTFQSIKKVSYVFLQSIMNLKMLKSLRLICTTVFSRNFEN